MEPFLAVVLFGEGGFAVAVQFLLINPFFVLGIWLRSPQSSSKNTSDLSLRCRDVPLSMGAASRAEPSPFPHQLHLPWVHLPSLTTDANKIHPNQPG